MKRIAILIPTLYGGGAEKVAANFSLFLNERGYEVFFFLDEFSTSNCYEHKGKEIVVHTSPLWSEGNQIAQLRNYSTRAIAYKKVKRKYKIDISISFMLGENMVNVLSSIGEKIILTVHSMTTYVSEYKNQIFANPRIIKLLYGKSDITIAVSKAVKYDLVNNIGVKSKKVRVIYNYVENKKINKMSRESVNDNLENTILFIGRLDDDKRPIVALRVMEKILKKKENVQMIFLGSGKNEEYLKKYVKRHKLCDQIKIMGFQNNVYKYMRHARFLIMTSETEAFPCVLIEAMEVGIPIIANNCKGGVREILYSAEVGECGVITPMIYTNNKQEQIKNEQKMADIICKYWDDEEWRKKIVNNQKRYIKNFYKDIITKEWIKVLEDKV